MKSPAYRLALCGVAGFGLAMIVLLAQMQPPPVEATSSTGTVTVQIVPPGGLVIESESVPPSPGTLSASILMLPDPVADEGSSYSGVFVVEDHRSRNCEWTVRLHHDSPDPVHLVSVDVGGAEVGPPAWAYEGVHAWDAAAGLSMVNAPQLASSTQENAGGCGLTVNRLILGIDPEKLGVVQTLTVILPAAP